MQINGIKGYNIAFKRKPTEAEKVELEAVSNEARDYLGIKNMAMIIHGSSYPSVENDCAIGSPYTEGALNLLKFEKLYGFNANQLGPSGKITAQNFSPYESKVFAKNHLFIDLKKLTEPGMCMLLSERTYNSVVGDYSLKDENYALTDFHEAFYNYDTALDEVFANFKNKLEAGNPDVIKLNREFIEFKAGKRKEFEPVDTRRKRSKQLERDGIFKVLSNLHRDDNFENWDNEIDKNLVNLATDGYRVAFIRLNQLINRSKNKIEKNSFIQFLADKQLRENKELRDEMGFKYINDLLVGFSKSDEWTNPDAFLKGYRMGSRDGGKGGSAQTWDVPVLDPKKLFNKDGTLGVSGELLKDKIDTFLDYFENLRIDHVLGLVDPYIYKSDSVVVKDGIVEKIIGDNISKISGIDSEGNYKQILEKIILPTLDEHGIDKREVVWEDICSPTDTFKEVYSAKNLPQITTLRWQKAEKESRNLDNWSMLGSHDHEPALRMNRYDAPDEIDYLAGYLNADPKDIDKKNKFREKINNNRFELLKARFVELFRSSANIQISFPDFFGIDRVYNHAGDKFNKENWKLRLNNNFEDTYYKNLSSEEPTAMNIPEILGMAVRAKNSMDVAKMTDINKEVSDKLRSELKEDTGFLLLELEKFAQILKEKESSKIDSQEDDDNSWALPT